MFCKQISFSENGKTHMSVRFQFRAQLGIHLEELKGSGYFPFLVLQNTTWRITHKGECITGFILTYILSFI